MRGKNVLKSTLLLSIMMMSTLAIVFPAAQAAGPAVLSLPQIIDPLKQPGQSLTVYVTVANVKKLMSFSVKVKWNPAVLTATGFSIFGGSPVFMALDPSKPSGIDNVLGNMSFSGYKIYPPAGFYKYYDKTGNGIWDVGERGVKDVDLNGVYNATVGDVQMMRVHNAGPGGPTGGVPLTLPGPNDKFYDTNGDGEWTRQPSTASQPQNRFLYEPAIRDTNNNDIYDAGDVKLYYDPGTGYPADGTTWKVQPPDNDGDGLSDYGAPLTGLTPRVALTTTDQLPIAAISFTVNIRGFSILDIYGSSLIDVFGATILPLQQKDGFFDNRFQGQLMAPVIEDLSLVQGSEFTVDIAVNKVQKLWGYQFILSYDTNVLTATSWEHLGVFNTTGPWVIDDTAGFIALSASSYFGDPTGLTTNVPVAIARIHFKVDSVKGGWSVLDIHDEVMTNVNGDVRILEVFDGSFQNIYVAELAGNKLRVEHRTFHQASELALGEDLLNDVLTPIHYTPSAEAAPVTFKVVFTVYDFASGTMLGTFESATYTLAPHTTISVITGFDTADPRWGTVPYGVLLTAKILWDSTLDGRFASEGGPIGSFDFRVLP